MRTNVTVDRLTSQNACDTIDGVKEVPLWSLRPGQRFALVLNATTPYPHKRKLGTVVRKGPGTIAVILDHAEQERTFVTKEGQEVVLHTSGGICYWSPGTAVLPVPGERPDVVARFTTRGGTGVGPNPDYVEPEVETEKENSAMATERIAALPFGPAVKAAAKPTGKPVVVKSKPNGKVPVKAKSKAPKELHDCLCGCGERVAGRFRQGHDGRYYSILKKVVGQEMTFDEMPRKMKVDLVNVGGVRKALAASNHK